MKGLVQELLTLTRVESQHTFENRKPVQLEPVILEAIKRVEVLNPDFEFQVNTEEMNECFHINKPAAFGANSPNRSR